MQEKTKLLSFTETASLLGVSAVSVKRWAAAGNLPTIHFSKRMVKIPLDKLEAFMDKGGIAVNTKQGA